MNNFFLYHSAEEGPEDEEDAERLDQQMGDVGDAAEDVDEKLWGDDEKEEDQKVRNFILLLF